MNWLTRKSSRDFVGGGLMIVIGLVAAFVGRTYPVGTLARMGPGYFPVSLGVILALVGLAIATGAKFAERSEEVKRLPPEWRGWICIGLSIVAFVVLGKYGGLVPATFAIVFISALGDRQNTLVSATVLALSIVAVCIVVFWWALQIQFSLFGWG